MLLQILHQQRPLSGYDINNLVEHYGFRGWAGIGVPSIYTSLSKLEKKQLLQSRLDIEKPGKGPTPKKFKLLPAGKKCLKREVQESILASPLKGDRFKLGIAGLTVLSQKEKITVFQRRYDALTKHLNILKQNTL